MYDRNYIVNTNIGFEKVSLVVTFVGLSCMDIHVFAYSLNISRVAKGICKDLQKIPKILDIFQNFCNVSEIYWKCSSFLQP